MTRILEGKNRATPSEAASFVDQYEALEKELASERGSFMAKCKAIRDRQKELLDDAKSQGVAKKLVKSIVGARDYEAKAKALRDELEKEDQDYFVDIRKALGDFADSPLGAAAVKREDGDADPIAAAADKAWSDADPKNKKASETAH